ncbi:MAG: sigma factor [Chloroflexia bacterium]
MDRHSRPVYSLALRVLRDPGWAEEVVQDVFLRSGQARAYDPTRGDLRRWLLTVCHHAAMGNLRNKRAPHAIRCRTWSAGDHTTPWRRSRRHRAAKA